MSPPPEILGHEDIRAALEADLPPATLLAGPPSIGKWTLANHLATHHGVALIDRLVFPDGLRMPDARRIVTFCASAPFGDHKLVMARLDGSSEPALHALLKTLEEPPGPIRFLLTSSTRTLDTIASRCQVYRCHTLSHHTLHTILRRHGLGERAARAAASNAPGQVTPALLAAGNEPSRQLVIDLLRALATSDAIGFHRHLGEFDEPAEALLLRALTEAATGRWRVFRATELPDTTPQRAREMLAALAALPTPTRPRLAVGATLRRFL